MSKSKTINQVYNIKSPISEVWKALTDPKYIDGWGGGPAKMDEKLDTKFSLWGGDIHGENIEVIKEKKLVQNWISGKWENPSVVTFELNAEGIDSASSGQDGTKLEFTQINIPENDFDDIEQGWKDYYLGPLKEYLEKK